ncbi:ABC transporter ATP-binding protein [Leucobacter sp. CSA1]|uniref:ABC transporter ATP-binding protein n=1 Tax=Leucobacter chromiisoli TaxID=2796471 RepID=A0A934Q4L1_9MICO|nr:ABC transporter ATP-binding protein [Leucobacter chromiisoli]MBK0417518.1 ABC transporter ATP-binding protein [Leucobacter chromiisoli]
MERRDPSRAGAPDDPVVRVRGLGKQYGGRTILGRLDLDIAPGETYALLGPNGAGKSTAIEILEGFRRPDAGEVRVLGQDPLTAPRSWRAGIGIVAQNTGDFGPYTPRELLTRFGGLYPRPRDVDEVLELVGLQDRAGVRATKLSGGQKRRLDVALGIVGRPELVFLDEPTTGFDPEARRQFWAMLRGLADGGASILLTTHYLDEAAQLADRVGVLSGGALVAEAPPALLGGAEARVPVVSWRDASGVLREQRTERPGDLVARLCSGSGADGAEPAELEIRRPSLEDIYLGLIGAEGAAAGSEGAAAGPEGAAAGSDGPDPAPHRGAHERTEQPA